MEDREGNPPQNTHPTGGSNPLTRNFQSKMNSEASPQQRLHFACHFLCLNPFCNYLNLVIWKPFQAFKIKHFHLESCYFWRFKGFAFEYPLRCFLEASWPQFWCLSKPLGEALGPFFAPTSDDTEFPFSLFESICFNMRPGPPKMAKRSPKTP